MPTQNEKEKRCFNKCFFLTYLDLMVLSLSYESLKHGDFFNLLFLFTHKLNLLENNAI